MNAPAIPTIRDLMRENANFVRYQDGKLWYKILWVHPHDNVPYLFEFPIPVDDAGGGEFLPTDKALTFMRWIRKHLDYIKESLGQSA